MFKIPDELNQGCFVINDCVLFAFVYSFFIPAEKKVHKSLKMSHYKSTHSFTNIQIWGCFQGVQNLAMSVSLSDIKARIRY